MPLPSNTSISLQGHSRPGEGVTTVPKVAMIVRMTEDTLNALQSLSGADRMDFEFGDKPGIYVRDQFFPMRYDKEKENQELFIRTTMPTRPNAPLRLNANVVGKFAVEQELSDKLDKLSQRLHNVNAAAARQKEQRKAIMVDTPPVTPPVPPKPAPKRKVPPKSMPKSTPTIVKSYATMPSNQPATSSASTTTALPKEVEATYELRLIHYLALGSATAQDIFKEFGGSEIDHNTRSGIMGIVFRVAEPEQVPRKSASASNTTYYRLKPQSWREVRPYQYSGYTDNVRTKVARTARTWFASLKIPEDDPVWEHVRFRDSGHGNAGSNSNSAQRATNGTTSAAARSKKTKATNVEVKVKSEAAPPPRPTQVPVSLPPKPNLPSFRSGTPVRSANGKEREDDTEKEEGELSASQTPPRISAPPAERRPTNSRTNGAMTPTMPPPPVPMTAQAPASQTLPSSTSSKRAGPVDARGVRRPPPEPSEPARAAPPIPPPDRKPIVPKDSKKERAVSRQEGNGVATPGSSIQSLKERELVKREKERESDRESIRAARRERERESDRESVRGRDKERAIRERDTVRNRDQEGAKEKLKQRDKVSVRPVAKTKAPPKRKASESSGEESSDWGYERRPSVKSKRNRESVSAKSVSSSLKVPKREPRDSPPPPKQKVKRSASPHPPPKPKPAGDRKTVVGSSKVIKKEVKADGISRLTAGKTHKMRASIDYTSSSEEEKEPKQKSSMTTSKSNASLAPKTSSSAVANRSLPPKPPRPRPTLSKQEQLRSRYASLYGEYITVFQKLVAQKNKVATVLRHGSESPSEDSDFDVDMMPLNELEELTARHQRLYDELEEIKKSYLA